MFKGIKKLSGSKGFTLIELLVVIAIIGILSSVVLTSLSSSKRKGENAKIKAQLSEARASAEFYHLNVGSYGPASVNCTTNPSLFAGPNSVSSGMAAHANVANYPAASGLTCFSGVSTYVMAYPLRLQEGTFLFWCVDHLGNSKGRATNVTSAAATGCNQ